MGNLFIFGDSITAGAWDTHGGWANRLALTVMQKTIESHFQPEGFYCLPYILGVSGDTVPDIMARLSREIADRCGGPCDKNEIIFSVGVNDSVMPTDHLLPRITESAFRENLQRLVDIATGITRRITFTGLVPVDEGKVTPIPWSNQLSYLNARVRSFEHIIGEVADNNRLAFIPLFDEWHNDARFKEWLIDGVHPNTDGHARLAERISRYMITDDFFSHHSL